MTSYIPASDVYVSGIFSYGGDLPLDYESNHIFMSDSQDLKILQYSDNDKLFNKRMGASTIEKVEFTFFIFLILLLSKFKLSIYSLLIFILLFTAKTKNFFEGNILL